MTLRFLLLLSFVFISLKSITQNLTHIYDFGGSEGCQSVIKTSDKGYFLGGSLYDNSTGKYDWSVVKTDSSGQLLWNKFFGGQENDMMGDVVEDEEGNLIIVGSTSSFNDLAGDIWVIKLGKTGNLIWEKKYGSLNLQDQAHSVIINNDKQIVITGASASFNADQWNASYILKIDTAGTQLFVKAFYQSLVNNVSFTIKQTADLGYVLGGNQLSSNQGSGAQIIRINSACDYVWSKIFFLNPGLEVNSSFVRDIIQNPDGSFLAVGNKNDSLVAFSVGSNGALIWEETFIDGSYNRISSVQPSEDGNFYFTGFTRDATLAPTLIFGNVDSTGSISVINNMQSSEGFGLVPAGNNQFAIAGRTGLEANPYNMLLILTDTAGDFGNTDLITGINEKASATDFPAFPNPSSDQVFISLANALNANVRFRLMDLAGKEITVPFFFQNNGIKVHITELPAGLYLFDVISADGSIKSGKLIKK